MTSASPPLFSVVTIALNCADDAERTARSVLAQDYPDVEYLVQDGGSTDGTPERLMALGVTEIVSAPDGGIYDAMNQAIARCRGSYVCFMNAGDEFVGPGVLRAVAQAITDAGHPDLLFGDIRSLVRHPFLSAAEQPAAGRLIRYPDRVGRFWLYRKMICHQAWFVRREIYAAQPFDTSFCILADYDYLLDLLLRRRARYAHLAEVVVIFDGGGLSTQASQRRDAERARALAHSYSPIELGIYQAVFGGMKWLNRTLVYPLIYPLLPERLRGRASGI
ncbi:glycosyltransferase [Chloroflexales bacterium ZM16-3]|nr:glycosyltransferase [Chloroflexales bacterium ZM16-3]